jgi:hypothetical protein
MFDKQRELSRNNINGYQAQVCKTEKQDKKFFVKRT